MAVGKLTIAFFRTSSYFLYTFPSQIGLPWWLSVKESTCSVGNLGSIPALEDPLEKGMTTHSSIMAWRIPWTVYSMVSQRVGHDWATFSFFTFKSNSFSYSKKSRVRRLRQHCVVGKILFTHIFRFCSFVSKLLKVKKSFIPTKMVVFNGRQRPL